MKDAPRKNPTAPAAITPGADAPTAAAPSMIEELSLLEDACPRLAPRVLEMRQQCIREYDLKTSAELMLLDQATLGYIYTLLMSKQAAGFLAPAGDAPVPPAAGGPAGEGKGRPREGSELQQARLDLVLRFHRMFVRSLWMIRRCKPQSVGDLMLDSLLGSRGP